MAEEAEAQPVVSKTEVEEGEEEALVKVDKKRKGRKDEGKEKEKNLRLLKQYLDSMAYKMPDKEVKAPPRIERLAKAYPLRFKTLHEEFGYVLTPKGRAKRAERTAQDMKVITTEQLQSFLQKADEREAIKKEARKRRERTFHKILTKLEEQCHEQIMKEIIDKFATYMAEKCANYMAPPVMTESAQRLTRGLVCNMYLSLGINQRPCNVDQSLYETIGLVLCDLILQALYMTQDCGAKPEKPASEPEEEDPHKDKTCLEQRAKQASKKQSKKGKLRHRRGQRIKIAKLPREFKDFMRLSKKNCIECQKSDDF